MTKYTHSNIIIDPTKKGIESLIGKDVYFNNNPSLCLAGANEKSTVSLGVLVEIHKDSITPFVVERNDTDLAYSCIIEKKEPCYEDQVKQWIEENNLKVGDYVKVTRRAENYADGLDDYWYDLMRDSVGKILKVKEISNFIMLDNGINYPYFVLEKAEKPEPKCVPFSNAKEFFNYYLSAESRLEKEDYFLSNHGIWLKDKTSKAYYMVTKIWDIGDDSDEISWKELLEYYTFLDDSPCGKEVEE